MDSVELLLHPLRLRIVHALTGSPGLTTAALCDRLPGVSRATVYRQVSLLADGGILEVTGEHRVRGAVERTYRLRRARGLLDTAAAGMSTSDHREVFAIAVATLLAEFDAYLDRTGADPAADQVGYRQHAVWLAESELTTLIENLRAAILPVLANEPAPGRGQYLLSPILFPRG